MSVLTIDVDRRGAGKARVSLAGPLDAHTAKQVEVTLNELIETKHLRLVLDLVRVDYLASTGVMLIVITQRRLREGGGKLVIVQPGLPVMEIFRLLGLHDIFTFAGDVDKAWAALK